MTWFRWTIGGLAALLAVFALFSLVVGVVWANDVWYGRARKGAQLLATTGLAWFNIEVWGRVVWTLLHWNS